MQRTLLATMSLGLLVATISPSFAQESFAQRHPRRAEVLHRDNRLNNRLNNNKGNLGGHYNQLKGEDRSIHQQERQDAAANGGHITRGERHQLNREENHVDRQIQRDKQ